MTTDLTHAAGRVAALVERIPDDALGAPTPCPDYTLGDLLDHVDSFSLAFRAAAKKETGAMSGPPPPGDASRLGDDWRTRIPRDLVAMGAAWREPDAWTGMTRAGGIDLPGEIAGLVALDELVVHGWDVARATAQPYECDRASLDAVLQFVAPFAAPGMEAQREGLFGPVVEVAEDAAMLDRVIGLTGRDPAWSPH